jgi:hypothetical protein
MILRRALAASALSLAALVANACDEWPGLDGKSDGGVSGGGTRSEDRSGRLGASCGDSLSSPCNTGLTCVTTFPGGMCTRSCQGDGDCAGGYCILSSLTCYPSCFDDRTCRSGYSCVQQASGRICAPGGTSTTPITDAGTD